MKLKFTAALCGAAFVPSLALAQNAATIAPLSTFGVSGYLAPGSNAYVTTDGKERGVAFNPLGIYDSNNPLASTAGDLYTSTINGTIGILSATTGALEGTLGSASNYSGSGESAPIDQIAVAGDGAIYVSNLTTNSNTTSAYKIYKYANEAAGTGSSPAGPTVVFSGNVDGARVGDDLAVYGTGTSTLLASGFASVADGYGITNVATGTTTYATFAGSSNNSDFAKGITFAASGNNVLGSQVSLAGTYRDTTYTTGSTSGTLVASPSLVTTAGNPNAGGEHILAYDVVDGVPILAAQSTGDSHVSIYDDTNPASPVLLVADNAPTGASAYSGTNGNGTGEIAFSPVFNTDEVNVYTLSSNEGIAAYTVTVSTPEPASLALFGLAVPALMSRRRRVR